MKLPLDIEARVRLGEAVECPGCGRPLLFWVANYGLRPIDCNNPHCPIYRHSREQVYRNVRAIEGLYP